MPITAAAKLTPKCKTIGPSANPAALDTAVQAQVNTLIKADISNGGGVYSNTIVIGAVTPIIDSTNVVTYVGQVTWKEMVDPQ